MHDNGAQPSFGHRAFHLAALRDVERAVMQCDGEVVIVDAPQFLKNHLGLHAGVDEHQRGLVRLDALIDFGNGMTRGMPSPRQMFSCIEVVVTIGVAPPSARTRSACAPLPICGTR